MVTAEYEVRIRPGRELSGIILANRLWEWLLAGISLAAVAWLMMEYHRLWRAKGYSAATLNECLAIAGTVGIASAMGLGRSSAAWLLRLRRPIGVVGVSMLLMHGVISLLMFQKYVLQWSACSSLGLGVVALAGLVGLWAMSYPWALRRFGPAGWKRLQRWGYLLLALGLLHFVVLGKIPGWLAWFRNHDKPMPPGTIIPFALGVFVLCSRALAALRHGGDSA